MGNIFKFLGIGTLLIFSFFYIHEINNYLIVNSNLITVINENKEYYEAEAVNALIYDDYIIPGIKGISVNVLESYYKMSPYDMFNKYFLVYDETFPSVSLSDNLDKYIEKGNSYKRVVSIIIDNNIEIESFIIQNDIEANKLITYENFYNSSLELINNDYEYFYKLEKLLDNKICIVNSYNEYVCRENEYYLVIPTTIDNENFLEIKNNIYSGQILLIDDNLDLEYFKLLYLEIFFRAYDVVFLSEMLSE